VFTSDPAGNFHLVYGMVDSGDEYVLYRPLPLKASAFGDAQQIAVNDIQLWEGPPIVQFDGQNNVYVFWKQVESLAIPATSTALYCNIKRASTASEFDPSSAAIVTDDLRGGDLWKPPFHLVGDVQVTPGGQIHAAWRSYDMMVKAAPLWYRLKDFDLDPAAGWHDPQPVAWIEDDSTTLGGGVNRMTLVRPAGDGTVHMFWSEAGFGGSSYDLHYAWLAPDGETWRDGGIATRATDLATSPYGAANNYFLDAGLEEDGTPFVLWTANPSGGGSGNIAYSHRWNGKWPVGLDLNGPDHALWMGDFWVGQDPEGKVHAIWMQEVDPFDHAGYYDLIHGNGVVPCPVFWRAPIEMIKG